jgi:NADH dehydrogenase
MGQDRGVAQTRFAGPIAITGANSAVGRALIELLRLSRGAPAGGVVACVRSARAAATLPPLPPDSRVAEVDFGDDASLRDAFRDARAVVHLPGVLIERPGADYMLANATSAAATARAAARCGVPKLVLVSAIGADATSANRYYGSKGLAELAVLRAGVEATVIRAPLVLGPGTEGSAALQRQIRRARPLLLGGGRHLQQPLDVRDLARGALRATVRGVAAGRRLDLVGPETLAYRDLVERAAAAMSRRVRPRVAPIPVALLRLVLRLRRRVVGSGTSADALDVILDGHTVDPRPAAEALGLVLTPLAETLRTLGEASGDPGAHPPRDRGGAGTPSPGGTGAAGEPSARVRGERP